MNAHTVERPAVGSRDDRQLVLGFRQRHVEGRLTLVCAGEQELQGQRRLAGPGVAFHQIQPVGREPAAENGVQSLDGGFDARGSHP